LGYSSSDNLLSFGYGGTIVLAIRLEERGTPNGMRKKRQTDDNSTSTDAPTTTLSPTTVTTPEPTTTTTARPVINILI
jgi:hypothetical protein